MRKLRFTDSQILAILKQAEDGVVIRQVLPVAEAVSNMFTILYYQAETGRVTPEDFQEALDTIRQVTRNRPRQKMMNDKTERITRKSSTPIKVYCLPEEKEQIEAQAKRAGMSAARYLREVGQGYHISGVVDYEQVRELARINGDLGRLGGLLKLWLTDDVRTAQFGQSTILAVLSKIEATQEDMGNIMTKVVMPRSDL